MILVIDGYNLLKHIDPYREVSEHERTVFLHMLKRYARRKKHKLVVVFDGGPFEWPHRETVGGATVIYSGRRETADEVIMHYVKDHKAKDLLLVSSDHELNLFASKHGIVSIGSDDFYRLVQDALEKSGTQDEDASVTFDEHETDIDAVMEQASKIVPRKQEDMEPSRISGPAVHRPSKKDRLLLKKLKKL